MSARDYYRREESQRKKMFAPIKRWSRYCWKMSTEVTFEGAKCTQVGCTERFTTGCMEDARLVV